MNTAADTGPAPTRRLRSRRARLARGLVLRRLQRITTGCIELREGDERTTLGVPDAAGLRCELTVRDAAFYRKVLLGGSIGAAESYMDGDWTTDDLTGLVRIFARDTSAADGLERGVARIRAVFERFGQRARANTVAGSRRNIAAHYDLGNEFFALFLDRTMTYSCALFDGPDDTLEAASTRKYDLICRKLELGPQDEVLEIGTGWGGFAVHAASRYGCRVTTTTISRRQHEYAAKLVREHGLEERITLLRQDYRRLPALTGRRFSRLVSIEMIEAVGHERLGEFFRVCSELLADDGTMLLQVIVHPDQNYRHYLRSVDFSRRYIFPGGCTPSLTALCEAMTRASELRVAHLQEIGAHYATTLRAWRERFLERLPEVESLGFPGSFQRMWEFYFAYCEAGFRERLIGDLQLLLTHPRARVPARVPQR